MASFRVVQTTPAADGSYKQLRVEDALAYLDKVCFYISTVCCHLGRAHQHGTSSVFSISFHRVTHRFCRSSNNLAISLRSTTSSLRS
jgi:hypothetical protein